MAHDKHEKHGKKVDTYHAFETMRGTGKQSGQAIDLPGHPKVIVVMPAYNAEKTIEKTVNDIPKGLASEIILVDDRSHDGTIREARRLGLTTIAHEDNQGYGGNQKTCYDEALKRGADIVIMIHPDYQYDSSLAVNMVRPIAEGRADVMLGSRIRSRAEALSGGMPVWKYIPNRFLTTVENMVLGLNMSEYHTGYRAYSRKVLETIPYHNFSNDFVFDSEFLVASRYFGFRFDETPVPVRYFDEASSISFKRSVTYGLSTLWCLVRYLSQKWGVKSSRLFVKQKIASHEVK